MAQIMMLLVALPSLLFPLCDCRATPYVDMTYPLSPSTLHWPGNTKFNFTKTFKGPYGLTPWVEFNDFEVAEHLGTHMDAPAHFAKGAWYMHEIPIDNFVGPAVVIDISAKAAEDKDAQVTVKDLEDWEEKHGQIPKGSIVLMNSGWGKYWGNRTLFRGNDTDDPRYLHFPGFHVDAARWLIANRDINGVGVDTLSIDHGPSADYIAHQILQKENIFALEMVANLDQLPPKGAMLYVLPMKIVKGSGGATRILAVKNGYISKGVVGVQMTHLTATMVIFSLISCIV